MGPVLPEQRVGWLRREDSNLQSPDPESGGLPISRLLSADFTYSGEPPRFQVRFGLTGGCGAVAQGLGVMVDQLIASLQQGGVAAMLLDHVAQFSEVMHQ